MISDTPHESTVRERAVISRVALYGAVAWLVILAVQVIASIL